MQFNMHFQNMVIVSNPKLTGDSTSHYLIMEEKSIGICYKNKGESYEFDKIEDW